MIIDSNRRWFEVVALQFPAVTWVKPIIWLRFTRIRNGDYRVTMCDEGQTIREVDMVSNLELERPERLEEQKLSSELDLFDEITATLNKMCLELDVYPVQFVKLSDSQYRILIGRNEVYQERCRTSSASLRTLSTCVKQLPFVLFVLVLAGGYAYPPSLQVVFWFMMITLPFWFITRI
jgi:hypothetical protein